jgi:uncharacterized protein with ParB-like and HNH nuclease domain
MPNNDLVLKSINELLGLTFYIPSYQRGYRWTKDHATDLLDDIYEFAFKDGKFKDRFYCLQPIVVKEKKEEWEVIDGQQRLTTILIILNFFNETHFKIGKKVFDIEFATRIGSREFLKNINLSKKDENVDYFHICQVKEEVIKWFGEKEKYNAAIAGDFYSVLINRTKIIWYQVNDESESSNAIEIFTRINMGKIPLTNAELIKALFLRERNFLHQNNKDEVRLKQLQIASEWDYIEYELQKDSFWYFIHDDPDSYPTRIEFIFDLIHEKMRQKKGDVDYYYTFHEFNKQFETDMNIDKSWLHIKKYFLIFEGWYNDRELYHLIGFLLAINSKINILDLIKESEKRTKTDFKNFLRETIKSEFIDKKGEAINIDELNYENDSTMIRTVLLLFNIETILSNKESNMRFPFDRFKKEHWDIEHIRAVRDRKPENVDRKRWLKAVLQYFTGFCETDQLPEDLNGLQPNQLIVDLKELINNETISDPGFDAFYDRLLEHFRENDVPEYINSIQNLTLLDSGTNRSYKNSVFPVKRKIIFTNDKNGTFIPICTKNVFLKYYSNKINDMMYWKEEDGKDYLKAIQITLDFYLPKNNGVMRNDQ